VVCLAADALREAQGEIAVAEITGLTDVRVIVRLAGGTNTL
jgi:hypothetical protein